MAKEKFERTKPHVNFQSVRLQQAGLSAIGARQALQGQPITDAADRAVVAEILNAIASNNSKLDLTGRTANPA